LQFACHAMALLLLGWIFLLWSMCMFYSPEFIVLYIPPVWPFHNLALISCFITGPVDGRLWGVSDSFGVGQILFRYIYP
jgi:hypothetical protein